jgi:hypothetical protein
MDRGRVFRRWPLFGAKVLNLGLLSTLPFGSFGPKVAQTSRNVRFGRYLRPNTITPGGFSPSRLAENPIILLVSVECTTHVVGYIMNIISLRLIYYSLPCLVFILQTFSMHSSLHRLRALQVVQKVGLYCYRLYPKYQCLDS